ncbi:MAG: lysylphosphatidylglycerol synthase transmembrane domain-containing protein [Microthrixaceae bacterium]
MTSPTLPRRAMDQVPAVLAPIPTGENGRSYDRSPAAVIRLVLALFGLLVVGFLSELTPRAVAGLEQDLQAKAGAWASALGSLSQAIATGVALLLILVTITASLVTRRPRQFLTAVSAGVLAAGLVIGAAILWGTNSSVTSAEYQVGIVAAAVAMAASSFTVVNGAIVRWPTVVISTFTLIGVLGAEISLVSRVFVLLLGQAVGSAVAVVFGTASRQITESELIAAFERSNLPVGDLEPHGGDARGSQPWTARLATGTEVFIKVEAIDELRADQLFRIWRRLRLKDPADERAPSSVRRSAEHEAFVSQRAAVAGVRTPSVVGMGVLPDDRGVFTVFEALAAETLEDLPEVSDTALRSAWSQIQVLRRSGIAHRDLRAANLMCLKDEVWIIDFGFSEIAASDELLDRDIAEFLASSAVLVGVDRAVDVAVAVLGADTIAGAIPWLQASAVCAATRAALTKSDFVDLRERVRAAAGISAPELPQLNRVTWKGVAITLALGIAIWTLLPQLTSGIDWAAAFDAQRGWIVAALLASIATYVGAAISTRAAVLGQVPMPTTVLAQLASSFTNRVTPAKVGGVALNVRYLTKQGVDGSAAATGVGVSTAAGTVVHLTITLVIVLWAGNVGFPKVSTPPAWVLGVLAAVGLAVVVAAAKVSFLRSWCDRKIVPPLKRAYQSLLDLLHSPFHLIMVFGGSAMVTLANLLAFYFSLQAFDISVAFATVGVVYLAGSAVASAAPTPGGLGATEAALVGGLSVLGVAQNEAIPAVLLFRLATFWVPILPGWIALTVLQRKGSL